MNYTLLSLACQKGHIDDIEKWLNEAEIKNEKINIFWHSNILIFNAAVHGGVDVMKVLIKYYEEHNLVGKAGTDEYLHSKLLLVNAMQIVNDSGMCILPEVVEVFQEYGVIMDDDKDSTYDLEDVPGSYDCDEEVPQGAVRHDFVDGEEDLSDHASTDYHSDGVPKSPVVDASESEHTSVNSLNDHLPLTGHDLSLTDL